MPPHRPCRRCRRPTDRAVSAAGIDCRFTTIGVQNGQRKFVYLHATQEWRALDRPDRSVFGVPTDVCHMDGGCPQWHQGLHPVRLASYDRHARRREFRRRHVLGKEHALKSVGTMSGWLLVYLIFLVLTALLAIGGLVIALMDLAVPDVFKTVWPHRNVLIAGLCALLLIALVAPMISGFGLESAAAAAAEKEVPPLGPKADNSAPGTKELQERDLRRDVAVNSFAIHRTYWLCATLLAASRCARRRRHDGVVRSSWGSARAAQSSGIVSRCESSNSPLLRHQAERQTFGAAARFQEFIERRGDRRVAVSWPNLLPASGSRYWSRRSCRRRPHCSRIASPPLR